MKHIGTLLLLHTLIVTAPAAVIITQWDFNNGTAPSTGDGSVVAVNATASNGSGYDSASSRSSDPVPSPSANNFALTLSGFPSSTTGNQTAGAYFSVSTVGYDNIQVRWDQRHSDTSSRYVRFQYTLDGASWIDANTFVADQTAATWFNGREVDLAGVTGAANNPDFAFRIVSEFESTATGEGAGSYIASRTGSTYGPAGTWRIDMVTLSGDVVPVPEPGTAALLLMGAVVFIMIARRRPAQQTPSPAPGSRSFAARRREQPRHR